MSRKVTFNLSLSDRLICQNIVARGDNWRERQGAHTLIRLDDGLFMQKMADEMGIDVRTVGLTRMHWLANGMDALKDAPRPGAPNKIRPDQVDQLKEAASLESLTAKELLVKHIEGGGTPVHLNTIRGALKKADFVLKRTRSS